MAATRYRVVARLAMAAFWALLSLSALTACSDSTDSGSDLAARPTQPALPTDAGTEPPDTGGLPHLPPAAPAGTGRPGGQCDSSEDRCIDGEEPPDIEERCVAPTSRTEVARLYYDRKVQLELRTGRDYTILLAPEEAAVSAPGSATEDFEVTCTIQAKLYGAREQLEVSPTGLQRQRYLPPTPTEFSWIVTAQETGTLPAKLQLQPVMRVQSGDDVEDFEGRAELITVTFVVPAAPSARDDGIVGQTGDVISASWDVVVSLATGVAALAAAFAAVHQLRKKRSKSAPTTGPAKAQAETAEASTPSGPPQDLTRTSGSPGSRRPGRRPPPPAHP